MAEDAAFESDMGIGLAVILGVLAIAGAATMAVAPGTVTGAIGFALAMTVGAILVVVLHLYE